MLASHAAIFSKALKNSKTLLYQLESIFATKNFLAPKDLTTNFSTLMKRTNKFDYLVFEFFIHELRPTLNVQSDSIHAKIFN